MKNNKQWRQTMAVGWMKQKEKYNGKIKMVSNLDDQ